MSYESLALDELHITTFDPHLCAKLYNELVDKAIGLRSEIFSRSEALAIPNDVPFSHPRVPNEAITNHLSTSVITFLRECKLFSDYSPDACLMPFIQPLDPRKFWMYQDWRETSQNPSAICLFQEAPYMDEGGIFFDQNTELARYVRFPWPEDDRSSDWMPLELIFRKWLKMWDLDQICLDYDGEDPTDINWSGICKLGWNDQSLCELDRTLSAWNDLLDAIMSRMPREALVAPASDTEVGLVSRVVVYEDRSGLSQRFTFAKDFLEHARRPPLLRSGNSLSIAPGLITATGQTLEPGLSMINSQIIFPVGSGNNMTRNSSGLHFMHEAYPFMDQVAYYAAGPGGRLAQKRFFQPWDEMNRYLHCPWNVMRRLRLIDILQIWRLCIEESQWTIGPDGVQGSIRDLEAAGNSFARLSWQKVGI